MTQAGSPILLHPMPVWRISWTTIKVSTRKLPELILWAVLFFLVPGLLTYFFGRKDLLWPDGHDFPLWKTVMPLAGLYLLAGTWLYAVAAIMLSLAVENWRASPWQIARRLG